MKVHDHRRNVAKAVGETSSEGFLVNTLVGT